jgi:hypothetical protein
MFDFERVLDYANTPLPLKVWTFPQNLFIKIFCKPVFAH